MAGQPETRLDAASDPADSTAESLDAGPGNLRLDPAATGIPKPRKSRARARKPAKPADSSAPDSAPVTWVRVGPGKFVRSDTIHQEQPPVEALAPAEVPPPAEAPPPAEVQNVAAPGDPVTDHPEVATAEPAALIEASPAADVPNVDARASEEPAMVAQPATDAPDARIIPTPEDVATVAHPTADWPSTEPSAPEVVPENERAAEEYGIAPSAFDLVRGPLSLVRGSQADGKGCPEKPGPESPAAGADRADAQQRTPDTRQRTIRLVPRTLASRSRARRTCAAPSRRVVRRRPWPVTPGRSAGIGWKRAGDARRAYGRSEHIRHAWRARSPPSA
jgi:hypothetical protein